MADRVMEKEVVSRWIEVHDQEADVNDSKLLLDEEQAHRKQVEAALREAIVDYLEFHSHREFIKIVGEEV